MVESMTKAGDFSTCSFAATSMNSSMVPSSSTWEVVEDRLERLLDQKLTEQTQELMDQISKAMENLAGKVQSSSNRRKSESKHRSQSYHSSHQSPDSRGNLPSKGGHWISTKPGRRHVSSVQSLCEMESAFLQEVCDMRSERRRSLASVPDVPAEEAEVAVLPAPQKTMCVPPPAASALPGLLNSAGDAGDHADEETNQKRRARFQSTGSKLEILNQQAQGWVLDSHTHLSIEEHPKAELDPGSRLLLALPWWLYFAIGFPVFIVAIALIVLQCFAPGHGLTGAFSFSVASSILYGLVATLCASRLWRALQSQDLNLAVDKLHVFVADFKLHWSEVSGQEWRKYFVAWLFLVLCCMGENALEFWKLYEENVVQTSDLGSGDEAVLWLSYGLKLVALICFAMSSALLMAITYVQSHLLLGLDKVLDCWCGQIVNYPDFVEGVQSWNAMQALLKCIGRELASSFVTLQAVGASGFAFFLGGTVSLAFRTDFEPVPFMAEVLAAVPLPCLFFLNMRVCAHGAALTEKCRVIPAFVNQIPADDPVDADRQYLVRYITDSSAGFFVRDVRLTQEIFLKQFIVLGSLMSGVVSILSRVVL